MLGAALPPMPEKDGEHTLPPEVEVQLSQLAAQAAAKLLQKDQAEAQAMQAAQQAQDPLVQMQMQELKIKEAEVQRKAAKDKIDATAKADDIRLREQEIAGRQQLEALKVGAQIAKDKDAAIREDHREGARMGAEVAKHHAQLQSQQNKSQPKGAKPQ